MCDPHFADPWFKSWFLVVLQEDTYKQTNFFASSYVIQVDVFDENGRVNFHAVLVFVVVYIHKFVAVVMT